MKLHKKTGSRSSRFPFSGSCLLRQIDDIALDHASRLCAGRIPLGHQCAVVSTADNAHAVSPLHGSQRVAADGACVSVAIQSVRVAAADILALKLCEAIEHRSELLAGDEVIRAELAVAVAGSHANAGRPANGLGIPCAVSHIREVHGIVGVWTACDAPQDHDDLRTGDLVVGTKLAVAVAAHQAVVDAVVNAVVIPGISERIP